MREKTVLYARIMKKRFMDPIIIGFAMFAIFFGAGNFVFPPQIGVVAGSAWKTAILGMLITGIVLPMMTIVAMDNMGGDLQHLFAPVASWGHKAFMVLFIVVMLTIGPPRQAAVAVETGLFAIFPFMQGNTIIRILMLAIYFILVYYFSSNPSKIVDVIGKYLTPFLMITLIIIVCLGIFKPMGAMAEPKQDHIFVYAFTQAYQTGDVCVGIGICTTFILSVKAKGYTELRSRRSILLKAALVSLISLLVVYGGLLYLGATGSSVFSADMDHSSLLIALINGVSGRAGNIVLGIGIYLACLTSSIGMQTILSDFTVRLSNDKLSYKKCLLAYSILSFLLGCLGVANIIKYTYAIFVFIYPILIVVTLMGTFREAVPNHGAWKGAVLMAALVGLYEAVATLNDSGVTNIHIAPLEKLYGLLPFSAEGIGWVLPCAIGFIIGMLIVMLRKGKPYPMMEEA